jgi:NADPH-dependent 2,4-dienoyl-CoA reductase/sulfur reductase-like enzyme
MMQTYRFVILGGGMVAGYAAREMAAGGLRPGEMAILSADSAPPYERPPLSKGFLAGSEDAASLAINAPAFYAEHGIDLHLGTRVEALNLRRKHLRTAGGGDLGFERLLIATGARVRMLDVPGATLDGVYTLRSLDDATRLRQAATVAKRAVVLGASFVGMEVAATLCRRGIATTLVFPGWRVWDRLFTPEISTFFERYYAAQGVTLLPRTRLVAVEGWGRAAGVVLNDGRRLPTDLVVAGIGVQPATAVLEGSGLALDDGVLVDEYLESSVHGIYAAGDVARYRDLLSGIHRRVEHWDNAVEQGKHAARAMLGLRAPFLHVPYFFSDVFDLSYEFWGDPSGADELVYRGEVAAGRFSAWWLRAGQLIAAFVMNRPDDEREMAAAWIAARRRPTAATLRDEQTPLSAAVASNPVGPGGASDGRGYVAAAGSGRA